jgi:hypothetical protein
LTPQFGAMFLALICAHDRLLFCNRCQRLSKSPLDGAGFVFELMKLVRDSALIYW